MINVSEELKNLFEQESVYKQLVIEFEDDAIEPITNSRIVSEQVSLTQSICEEYQLRFGGCYASVFEVTVANLTENVNNMLIYPKLLIEGKEFALGTFIVASSKKIAGKPYKKITAYDLMANFDVDVKDWYSSLTFPITVKNFRDSLCNYCNVPQTQDGLIIDNIKLKKTLNSEATINGLSLLQQICEISGVFGRINHDGQLEYKSLGSSSLIPSDNLMPSDDLYPMGAKIDYEVAERLVRSYPIVEDFVTMPITGVVLTDEGNMDYKSGTLDNPYVISDNFVIYGLSDANKNEIVGSLLGKISAFTYRPVNDLQIVGQPYVEVGDLIRCEINGYNVETYVLKRELVGVQSLIDTFVSEGTEYLEDDVNSITRQLERLNRGVESVKVQVEATAEGLSSKVSKGDVVSEINQSADTVSITGNRFVVTSDNFKLTKAGKLTTTNAVLNDVTIKGGAIEVKGIDSSTGKEITTTMSAGLSFKESPYFNTLSARGSVRERNSVDTWTSDDYQGYYVDFDRVAEMDYHRNVFNKSGLSLGGNKGSQSAPVEYKATISASTGNAKFNTLTTNSTATVNKLKVGSDGTAVSTIRMGSSVLTGTGSTRISLATNVANTEVFALTNGDMDAFDGTVTAVIKSKTCYAVFNKAVPSGTLVRVNWVRYTN